VLKTLIANKFTPKATAAYKEMCEGTAVQASSKERNAMEAERKADDIKKCQYARRLVGERQQGIISGVTEHGIFVELANTVEGYISTDRLSTAGLKFDKARFCLYNDAVKYTLGSGLSVIIDSVNMAAAKIDMKLA
jgi:ribonuclease R